MEPCRCDAYKFPHRPGSGDCEGGKYLCEKCQAYAQDYDSKFISGRVGHIDNWLPDEEISICPNCGAKDTMYEVK